MFMRLSEDLVRRFLLGGLPEERRAEIEDLALRDEETFDLLEACEVELVDLYVRDELEPADRAAFERRLAPLPRIRERIANARVLAAAADRQAGPPPSGTAGHLRSARRLLPLAASLLLVLAGTLLVLRPGLLGPAGGPVPPPGEPASVYDLEPGVLRDVGGVQSIDRGARDWIGLRLDLNHPAVRRRSSAMSDLELTLESDASGEEIRRRRLEAEEIVRGTVSWVLPRSALEPGDYTLLLREVEAPEAILAHYVLTVR